jgi:hypothetical protein
MLALVLFPKEKGVTDFSVTPCIHSGGAGGNRTHDLLNAIQALSQLSYSPAARGEIIECPKKVKRFFGPRPIFSRALSFQIRFQ